MTKLLDKTKCAAISDELTALLVKDVRKKFPEWTDDFGHRSVDQMVGFLAACALSPEPLGPSMLVDEFWHALIVRTVDYTAFCDQLAGKSSTTSQTTSASTTRAFPARTPPCGRAPSGPSRRQAMTSTRRSGLTWARPTARSATRAATTAPSNG
ncbi:hypothetical protein [Catellatospora chokoriensis]|uniref:Uncharacterized protein n=1 Tax=Catellatospora chokoriensis TaxID=310353 RepID=A0A8J3NTA3_9ACTN|nr:hypothetical protein [Catellatospora chokoriensis]GIF91496.1 hypothetical protein Cch02nite_49400 [Catellatospora chokoriensis]